MEGPGMRSGLGLGFRRPYIATVSRTWYRVLQRGSDRGLGLSVGLGVEGHEVPGTCHHTDKDTAVSSSLTLGAQRFEHVDAWPVRRWCEAGTARRR